MHDEDRIVHNRPRQDHESQHREHVEWLKPELIQDPQSSQPADECKSNAHHDDQWIQK